jgi:phage/plasmid-associated DNA primase
MTTLAAERDGIVKLMIEGLRRLHRQGFTETPYQHAFVRDMEGLGSSIRAFVRECCELGTNKEISSNDLFRAYRQWSENDNVEHEQRGEREKFGRNLKAAFPKIERITRRGAKRYWYTGIDLRRRDDTAEGVAK